MSGINREAYMSCYNDGPPLPNIKEKRVIERISDTEKIIYVRIKIGPFASDRDNVVKWTRIEQPDGSVVMQIESVDHPDCPEVPNVVRIEIFKSVKIMESKENPADIEFMDFSIMNMKGYFPVRVFNMMMGSMMSKSMTNVYKIAKENQQNGVKVA